MMLRVNRSALLSLLLVSVSSISVAQLPLMMPRDGDQTSMWWRDGFPGVIPDASWRRIVRTGHYWFMLDTDTLKIPRLGTSAESPGELPPADLSLKMVVDGKTYLCKKGADWSRFAGPRLIESGRFLQRADITNLLLTAEDGSTLNAEARFETAAWSDQLALTFAARPGLLPLVAGEGSFGRVRGGFGLDGENRFEIPEKDCETPEKFTLEFWVFTPHDYQASPQIPWLVCKNSNELADGNYGIVIHHDGVPEVRINIGGGKENAHSVKAEPRHALRFEQWNHVAISYDGDLLRLYINGHFAVEEKIGLQRIPKSGGMAFGGRQDNHVAGYRFRGVIDEVRLYDRPLNLGELRLHFNAPEIDRPALKPIKEWIFRNDILMSSTKLSEKWNSASLQLSVANPEGQLSSKWDLPTRETWETRDWQKTTLMIDPVTFQTLSPPTRLSIEAIELATGDNHPVTYDPSVGWHRINLDGIEPIPPRGAQNPSNDAIEQIKLVLKNPTDREEIARLMFEKTSRGIRQKIGTPITGISAMLRDSEGFPTGIPVQLSKNWHVHPEGGEYSGQWFHGVSQVRLPPKADLELELTISYGHWGGVAAASHAQLSLIGWGSNQLWDQSALGSWGESICFEPEQIQGKCTITDVRPVMVTSEPNKPQWGWTTNVGGGDFLRMFDIENQRIPHSMMRADYHRQGPCLTEVSYMGGIGKTGINHHSTVSLARTDDIVCGTYRIRMNVTDAIDFSRFVIFQIGADTYATTCESKMAVGDETGLIKEWNTEWGGNLYRGVAHECQGRIPWASLHETEGNPDDTTQEGAWANRGIVIREWKARLGGKEARPWMAERGLDVRPRKQSSTLDIVPPPGVNRLEPGDFVEATIEHIIIPQYAKDYFGPNESLRAALTKDENTWRMVHRQAVGDDLQVTTKTGRLEHKYPNLLIATESGQAEFTLQGGLGYVPITFKNLPSHKGYTLKIDGQTIDQSVHGHDFWQTDYDVKAGLWSQTYNIPIDDLKILTIRFAPDE